MHIEDMGRFLKLGVYLVVIVLVNLAGMTVFFRADLTTDRIYTLSAASRETVATLSEPLTVKVFFTRDLPAPHNQTERYLHDLLEEYAIAGNRYFNYRFHDVSAEADSLDPAAAENRDLAREYGISPVQIQMVENDEIKFKQAYMGLVLIHGDLVERIPALTTVSGLEYRLTTAMQKLNNKVSALLNVDGDIAVRLVLSSSLERVAPLMGLDALPGFVNDVKAIVEKVNARNYGKLKFVHIDPDTDPATAAKLADRQLMQLSWPDVPQAGVAAGEGMIGMVMAYGDRTRDLPVLNVFRLPIIGTRYELADAAAIEEMINTAIDRLVDINTELGMLSGHGCLDAGGFDPMMGGGSPDALNNFAALAGQNYSLKPVRLADGGIPPGLRTLVIVRPTESLSDYELYQIDQALMHGTSLALFVDTFAEAQPPAGQQMFSRQPTYKPLDTGLEKLLAHYGVRLQNALVLDEKCYHQRLDRRMGGGEQPIYYAPLIERENINQELDYIKNVKGLIALKIAPLELDRERLEAQSAAAHLLFSSSDRSWVVRDNITLNPMFMRPPAAAEEFAGRPLAYLLEGSFTSYFSGKPRPEKPAGTTADDKDATGGGSETETAAAGDGAAKTAAKETAGKPSLRADVRGEGDFVERSPAVKILVVPSGDMLRDNLLDEQGQTTNTMFVLNLIDVLNGREDIAAMRSKEQRFNPLAETDPAFRTLVKGVNIAGLPLLVVLAGLAVWVRRRGRKKRIQRMFAG
ncbi:MAG: Gldg family protein [Deltaproteobacteria bacterium]|nr:Gldg family protein [Candidatus Anaeroferrophillacea bacterium]